MLALFNLVPAFPMDGGRVLRALLSGWLGRLRATAVAANIGRVLALGFGLYGLVHLDFFKVALALFIYTMAGIELARVTSEERPRQPDGAGVWTAPPGYRWVSRGDGVWQLDPIAAPANDRMHPSWM